MDYLGKELFPENTQLEEEKNDFPELDENQEQSIEDIARQLAQQLDLN